MATYTRAAGTIRGIPFPELNSETTKNKSCTIEITNLKYNTGSSEWTSDAKLTIGYTDLSDGQNKETVITSNPFVINWTGGGLG